MRVEGCRRRGAASSPPRRDTAVERGFDGAPIRQVRAEDGLESRAVRRFEEVGQFMEHHAIDGGQTRNGYPPGFQCDGNKKATLREKGGLYSARMIRAGKGVQQITR